MNFSKNMYARYCFRVTLALMILFSGFKILDEPLQKVSLDITTRTVHQKQSFTLKGVMHYSLTKGILITHYTFPKENIVITNSKGEMKAYNPGTNEVSVKQDQSYSSEGNFFTFFFNGKISDMGLSSMGFTPTKTRFEKDLEIKTFLSPADPKGKTVHAELVSKKFTPIYLSFFSSENKKIKKIYFSDYSIVNNFNFPKKITEITYVLEKDSVISQQIFTNIKSNSQVDDKLFEFKIPASAKLVK